MRVVVVKRNQCGAILTFELSILMVLVASIAIGAGVIIGSKLPQVLNAWLNAAVIATTYTAYGNVVNACNVANGDSINALASSLFQNGGGGGVSAFQLAPSSANPVCDMKVFPQQTF
ncbi:MAG: hypothetical protein WC627_00125 [Legionella sp.]|jgi:hypothetical protein